MRRAVAIATALLVSSGAAFAQIGAQVSSTTLTLQRVAVELPSLEVATVVLHAGAAAAPLKGPFNLQKLRLGSVEIPMLSPATIVPAQGGVTVRLEVQLRAVPEMVLTLPIESIPVSWEGYTEDGLNKVAIEGKVNPADPGSVDVPVRTLYQNFSKIADVRMSTDEGKVLVRVLASLYNPFSFDLVATMMDYKVRAGDREIVAGQRRGFRVRGRRWSDVLIEQEVAPGDAAAGGIAALLKPGSVQVDGRMMIRTPVGDRGLQLKLGGS
jgi:hypothetical protein